MDKITRLIQFQRFAIVVLLVGLGLMTLSATDSQSTVRFYQAKLLALARITDQDEQVIHDLRQRLGKYEAKYGNIDTRPEGKGVILPSGQTFKPFHNPMP